MPGLRPGPGLPRRSANRSHHPAGSPRQGTRRGYAGTPGTARAHCARPYGQTLAAPRRTRRRGACPAWEIPPTSRTWQPLKRSQSRSSIPLGLPPRRLGNFSGIPNPLSLILSTMGGARHRTLILVDSVPLRCVTPKCTNRIERGCRTWTSKSTRPCLSTDTDKSGCGHPLGRTPGLSP